MKTLPKKTRIKIYKKAFELFKNHHRDYRGICSNIIDAATMLGYKATLVTYDDINNIKMLWPELYSYKPKHVRLLSFWWNSNNRSYRTMVFNRLIQGKSKGDE